MQKGEKKKPTLPVYQVFSADALRIVLVWLLFCDSWKIHGSSAWQLEISPFYKNGVFSISENEEWFLNCFYSLQNV